jgi:hypothetical protein
MRNHEHKVNIIKRNPMRRIMQLVFALLRGKVSLFKVSQRLPAKAPCSSLMLGPIQYDM